MAYVTCSGTADCLSNFKHIFANFYEPAPVVELREYYTHHLVELVCVVSRYVVVAVDRNFAVVYVGC